MNRIRKWLHLSPLAAAVCCCVTFATVAGCGETPPPADAATEQRLRQLANAYLNYAVARGTGPANAEALRQNMHAILPFGGEGAVVDERAFHSERDGLPFEIRFGQPISQATGLEAPVLAHEVKGADGTRYVACANGHVELLGEDKLSTLLKH